MSGKMKMQEPEIKRIIEKQPTLLELGLKNVKSEVIVYDARVDFFAWDKDEKPVLIEVETKADWKAVGQILSYMSCYTEANPKKKNVEKVRGIIVAGEIAKSCKRIVKFLNDKGLSIDLHECILESGLPKIGKVNLI